MSTVLPARTIHLILVVWLREKHGKKILLKIGVE